MITKKWVEARLKQHNQDDLEILEELQKQTGWHKDPLGFFSKGMMVPYISVNEKIDALYEHLGLESRRTERASTVVARKIKKAK